MKAVKTSTKMATEAASHGTDLRIAVWQKQQEHHTHQEVHYEWRQRRVPSEAGTTFERHQGFGLRDGEQGKLVGQPCEPACGKPRKEKMGGCERDVGKERRQCGGCEPL